MSLFSCHEAKACSISDATAIWTPLGIVRLGAICGDLAVNMQTPDSTYRLAREGWIAAWKSYGMQIELLVSRPLLQSALEVPVTACWGILWRGRATVDAGPLTLSVAWDDGYSWVESGPNGGQYLYAKTWTDRFVDVTIGTQDDDMLKSRAHAGDYLPSEWVSYFSGPHPEASQFWRHPAHQMKPDSIVCPLPLLNAGEEFQIQFAVAWAVSDDVSGTATSMAVEASPSEILAGARCSK